MPYEPPVFIQNIAQAFTGFKFFCDKQQNPIDIPQKSVYNYDKTAKAKPGHCGGIFCRAGLRTAEKLHRKQRILTGMVHEGKRLSENIRVSERGKHRLLRESGRYLIFADRRFPFLMMEKRTAGRKEELAWGRH